jgi:hypothetical protein
MVGQHPSLPSASAGMLQTTWSANTGNLTCMLLPVPRRLRRWLTGVVKPSVQPAALLQETLILKGCPCLCIPGPCSICHPCCYVMGMSCTPMVMVAVDSMQRAGRTHTRQAQGWAAAAPAATGAAVDKGGTSAGAG